MMTSKFLNKSLFIWICIMNRKNCVICSEPFKVSSFNSSKKYCSDVCKESGKSQRNKTQKLKSTYGISIEVYQKLLETQQNRCAICVRKIDGNVNSEKLRAFVDHNHQTGQVRGLLCVHCNSIVGYCREDKSILLQAIQYLKKFKRESYQGHSF